MFSEPGSTAAQHVPKDSSTGPCVESTGGGRSLSPGPRSVADFLYVLACMTGLNLQLLPAAIKWAGLCTRCLSIPGLQSPQPLETDIKSAFLPEDR